MAVGTFQAALTQPLLKLPPEITRMIVAHLATTTAEPAKVIDSIAALSKTSRHFRAFMDSQGDLSRLGAMSNALRTGRVPNTRLEASIERVASLSDEPIAAFAALPFPFDVLSPRNLGLVELIDHVVGNPSLTDKTRSDLLLSVAYEATHDAHSPSGAGFVLARVADAARRLDSHAAGARVAFGLLRDVPQVDHGSANRIIDSACSRAVGESDDAPALLDMCFETFEDLQQRGFRGPPPERFLVSLGNIPTFETPASLLPEFRRLASIYATADPLVGLKEGHPLQRLLSGLDWDPEALTLIQNEVERIEDAWHHVGARISLGSHRILTLNKAARKTEVEDLAALVAAVPDLPAGTRRRSALRRHAAHFTAELLSLARRHAPDSVPELEAERLRLTRRPSVAAKP